LQKFENHESIAGRLHDRFAECGKGHIYLDLRNKNCKSHGPAAFLRKEEDLNCLDSQLSNGNGYHSEIYEGHSRFQSTGLRNHFSYNNNYGYRRNIPSLRQQPSTFMTDMKWLVHLKNEFKNDYSPEQIQNHYEATYISGNPFYDIDQNGQTDYRDFHTSMSFDKKN
jgi:hypothetical protein